MSRGRGQRTESMVNLLSDESLMWRFIGRMVAGQANDIGKAGYQLPHVQEGLTALQKTLGPTLASWSIGGLAALVQNPTIMKTFMRSFGIPEQAIALVDEAIDDAFEGVRMAMLDDNGRAKESDVEGALTGSLNRLRMKLNQGGSQGIVDAILKLGPDAQVEMNALMRNMDPETRKVFEIYRSRLVSAGILQMLMNSVKGLSLSKTLSDEEKIGKQNQEIAAFLERMFGPPPKPSVAADFSSLAAELAKKAKTVLVKATEPLSDEERKRRAESHDARMKEVAEETSRLEEKFGISKPNKP